LIAGMIVIAGRLDERRRTMVGSVEATVPIGDQ